MRIYSRDPIFICMIRLKHLLQEWTGETWTSCRQWASHRNLYMGQHESINVSMEATTTQFQLTYVGPSSGISLAHAKGGSGDTLHQVFNILICEINQWLADSQYKPEARGIQTQCIKLDDRYELSIRVPIMESDRSWQMNHRGGWGHDPGVGAVLSATPDSPDREVYTETTAIPGNGKITTHFAVYPA